MLEIKNSEHGHGNKPVISVVGIGGGGNNAVDRIIEAGLANVNFIAVNTDYQVLEDTQAPVKLQIGSKLTGGFGAGADPDVGAASAEESTEEIKEALSSSNMVILTCGLGGGTGTGAIPVIAQICRELKILTIAVVTLPFTFEGGPKQKLAEDGLEKLRDNVDMLLVIPNDKLLNFSERNFYLDDAFVMADNVLKYTIEGITNIIFGKGMINLDFNDIKTTLSDKGIGHLGIGRISRDGSIMDAVRQAIESPLLDTDITTAGHILLNTSGRINVLELNEAVSYIKEITNPNVTILWGTVTDPNTPDEIVVTLIATGLVEKKSGTESKRTVATGRTSYNAPSYNGTIDSSATSAEAGNRSIDIPQFVSHKASTSSQWPVIPEFLRRYTVDTARRKG